MTLFEWASLAAVCLLGAMSPGPSLAVVVKQTLHGGAGAGVRAGAAHGFGVALYAVAVVSGLAVMITTSPGLFAALQYAGAGFLAWLGIKSLRSQPGQEETASSKAAGNPVVEGFAVAFLNPKLAIFFLALFSQFLDVTASITEKVLMVVTMGVIDGGWYCGIALLLARPALLPRLQAARVTIDRVFGVILLGLALRIVLQAFS